MTSDNSILGIGLGTKRRRRIFVCASYLFLLLVPVAAWLASHDFSFVTVAALFAAAGVNYVVFGFGVGSRPGIIKPFRDVPPPAKSMPDGLIGLAIYRFGQLPFHAWKDIDAWKNDERELRRRDAAHYVAYQPLAAAMPVVVVIAGLALHRPSWIPADVLPLLIYGIALPTSVLAATLPQAIILWTEPDMVELEDAGMKEPKLPGIGTVLGANSKA